MSHYTIRAYQQGDETEIVSLFSIVFKQMISVDFWRWKFCQRKTVYSMVAQSQESGAIIGHVGAIPLEGIYQGQPILCFQMCDVMIHPDARGFLGKRNLFTQLFIEMSEFIAHKHPKAFCYGFPGRRPFLLGQRARAYSRVEQPVISQYPSRYSTFRLFQLRSLEWSDRRLERLWRGLSGQYQLSVVRDSRYLHWRYACHPGQDYQFVGFYLLGRLSGWAVVQIMGQSLLVIDLLIHKRWLKSVLNTISSYAAALNLDEVTIWLPNGWRDFDSNQDFHVRQSLSDIVTTNVVWSFPMETETVRQYFYYTMGDLDIF